MNTTIPKIALGAWSWGAGAAGGDQVFGNHLGDETGVHTLREWEKEMLSSAGAYGTAHRKKD